MIGRIHSIETMGTVDGPGLRYVIFTQGCPLRCMYCHNPDTQNMEGGKEMSVEEIVKDVLRYKSYLKNGGVTLTGGDPMAQPKFAKALFKALQEVGIHTALDTSGFAAISKYKEVLEYTDLVLLDLKAVEDSRHKALTGYPIAPTLEVLNYLDSIGKPTWIRFVFVPSLNGFLHLLEDMADFLQSMKNIEKIEVLPFHKMGEQKYEELGMKYELSEIPTPTPEQTERVRDVFREMGFKVN